MARSIESRIDSLANRDRLLAVTFTVLMWTTLIFVFIVASANAPSSSFSLILLISMLLLGVFNTASTVQMVRAYFANKVLIYEQDIVNSDLDRRARGKEIW
ncbi:MAG: hypothetical protein GEU86_21740 [Actinophytocola sp.]|nr:hypothetical protein [Actinophytocola sp.]